MEIILAAVLILVVLGSLEAGTGRRRVRRGKDSRQAVARRRCSIDQTRPFLRLSGSPHR